MIDQELIALLACPETQQPLTLADDDLLKRFNEAISSESIRNRDQKVLKDACDALLIREDKKYAYPVVKNIPVLIVEEGIDLGKQL